MESRDALQTMLDERFPEGMRLTSRSTVYPYGSYHVLVPRILVLADGVILVQLHHDAATLTLSEVATTGSTVVLRGEGFEYLLNPVGDDPNLEELLEDREAWDDERLAREREWYEGWMSV